ncbi:hypothetical protein, partial [Microcoleus sp.]|uniref:hypothetical protein n=1 Tax=Microcoleus sp. TaxID=44472 RepID=UPI00403ED43D
LTYFTCLSCTLFSIARSKPRPRNMHSIIQQALSKITVVIIPELADNYSLSQKDEVLMGIGHRA